MPGYIYRGNEPWEGPSTRNYATGGNDKPKRTHCARGHDQRGKESRQCLECQNERVRRRVVCTGCGDEMNYGAFGRHRKRKPDCIDASAAVPAGE